MNTNFSLPQYCERLEKIRFQPDNNFTIPASGVAQAQKNAIRYTIQDRTGIYDWSKGYFLVSFDLRLTTASGAGDTEISLIASDKTAIINGVFSLIKRLVVQASNGVVPYDVNYANLAIHWKKLFEYGPDYAKSVATNECYFLDTTADANTSVGHAERLTNFSVGADKTAAPNVVSFKLPLSSYSYFKSLEFNNVFLTGTQISILVDIETDANLIWQIGGKAAAKLVIRSMDLMLPQLTLHPDAYESYIKTIETPLRWGYERERIEKYAALKTASGRFKINGVHNPSKMIIWFSSVSKENSITSNFQIADKFKAGIGGDGTLSSCYLEFSNGARYPRNDYLLGTAQTDIVRLYDDVLEWSNNNVNYQSGTQVTRALFDSLYNVIYFDLDYKARMLLSDNHDISFNWSLEGASTNDYYVYALILGNETASFGRVGDSYVLLSEISK